MHISDIKKNILIKRALRWDVTPEVLFRPRYTMGKERDLHKETEGYMFYIDYSEGVATSGVKGPVAPKLMLMRTVQLMSSTTGEVEGVPQEMLLRAVKAEGAKPVGGMYAISKELEEYLKTELGL